MTDVATVIGPIWVGIMLTWVSLACVASKSRHQWVRRAAFTAMITTAIALPLLLWNESAWSRGLSTIPMFIMIAKTAELATGRVAKHIELETVAQMLFWVIAIPEGRWPVSSEGRRDNRRRTLHIAVRFVGKVVAFLGLLAMNEWLPIHEYRVAQLVWMSLTLYVFFSGFYDGITTVWTAAGVEVSPMFVAPPIARNPRDFWGRRWNLWFTRTSHRLIFIPCGGASRPRSAAFAVFMASALVHEVIASVGMLQLDGRMTLFFVVHACGAMAFTKLHQVWPRPLPRPLAVVLHFSWLIATTPLFLDPIDEFVYLSQWNITRLGAFFAA